MKLITYFLIAILCSSYSFCEDLSLEVRVRPSGIEDELRMISIYPAIYNMGNVAIDVPRKEEGEDYEWKDGRMIRDYTVSYKYYLNCDWKDNDSYFVQPKGDFSMITLNPGEGTLLPRYKLYINKNIKGKIHLVIFYAVHDNMKDYFNCWSGRLKQEVTVNLDDWPLATVTNQ